MNNIEIRQAIKKKQLNYYEVAHRLGIHENTLGRKLRYELTAEEKDKILKTINENKKEN